MRKLFKTITMLVMLTSFLVLPGVAFAEEYKTEEEFKKEDEKTKGDVQKLEEIVVEAKRVEESIAAESISAPKLEEVGHNVEIITGEEIEEAGFVDLAKALESLVPGLFSSTSQGRGGYNRIRMHGSNEILWLLDGIRISAIHGATSHPWSYTLSVHMIDHIEILKGGESLFLSLFLSTSPKIPPQALSRAFIPAWSGKFFRKNAISGSFSSRSF